MFATREHDRNWPFLLALARGDREVRTRVARDRRGRWTRIPYPPRRWSAGRLRSVSPAVRHLGRRRGGRRGRGSRRLLDIPVARQPHQDHQEAPTDWGPVAARVRAVPDRGFRRRGCRSTQLPQPRREASVDDVEGWSGHALLRSAAWG